MYEELLIGMEFDVAVGFLTKLPDTITSNELFRNIDYLMRTNGSSENGKGRKKFNQILQEVNERICGSSNFNGNTPSIHQITENLQGMKMSKSLSEFVNDLLKSP
ncbi:unnamed protein product, partial [Mesorhabditis belari]